MRFGLPVLALATALLVSAFAVGGGSDAASAEDHVVVLTIQEVDDSGISGTVTLTAIGDDVQVVLDVSGLADDKTYLSGAYNTSSVTCVGGLLGGGFSATFAAADGGVTYTVARTALSDIFSVSVRDVTETGSAPGTVVACAEQGAADIFRQFVEAINQGDVAAALALFTDDATWERGGRCPPNECVGIAAVQGEIEKDVTDNHRIDIVSIEVSGNTVTARVELRTDGTRARSVERIIQIFTVEVTGDKISSLQAAPDLTDPVTADFAKGGPQGPPKTGGPPTALGDDASTWWQYLLIAGGALALLGGGTLAVRGRRVQ